MDMDEIMGKIDRDELTAEQVFWNMMPHVSRNDIIDEAIATINNCELVAPNVMRIRLHEAVGALYGLKSKPNKVTA